MTTAYPLSWPIGVLRNKYPSRSQFKTSISAAVKNVQDELRRFGNDSGIKVERVTISSNVTLVDQRPKDTGVACYFRWDGVDCCLAVDRYQKVEENLQAIAKVIEAERTKLRHGGLNIVKAGMRGFAALPPPKDEATGKLKAPWWQVLEFDAVPSLDNAEARYRAMVKECHPDGSRPNNSLFMAITDAIREGRLAHGQR